MEEKASGASMTLSQSGPILGLEGGGHFCANLMSGKFREFLNQPIPSPGHKH